MRDFSRMKREPSYSKPVILNILAKWEGVALSLFTGESANCQKQCLQSQITPRPVTTAWLDSTQRSVINSKGPPNYSKREKVQSNSHQGPLTKTCPCVIIAFLGQAHLART